MHWLLQPSASEPNLCDCEIRLRFEKTALPARSTPSGKAHFLVFPGCGEEPPQSDPDFLWLTTIRSHDQYNTTLYSLSDRYRGVFGQRDVVFLNEYELSKRGLADGDRVDLITASTDGAERIVRNFRVVAYSFPTGCCAAYYPETNPAGAALCP
jgi:anaerobic selenocysteine-containing dehydrogenase